jgi:hypothetical protein
MRSAREEQNLSVETVLRKLAASVIPEGPARWRCVLPNGSPLSIAVCLDEGWLVFQAPLPLPGSKRDPWRLLQLNAALRSPCRFANAAQDAAPQLRAELVLDRGDELLRRVAEVGKCLHAGVELLVHASAAAAPPRDAGCVEREHAGARARDLARICAEAEWPFTERAASGELAVELEVPGGCSPALLAPQGAAGARATVELARADGWSTQSQRATGVFLLSLSAAVRLVRPVVRTNGIESVGLEADWASTPAPAELARTFEALSVAARLSGRAVPALQDPTVALQYLEIRGAGAGHEGAAPASNSPPALAQGRQMPSPAPLQEEEQ